MSKHEELTGKPVSDIEEGELSDENEDKEKERIGKPYTKCSRVPHTLHRSRSSDDIIVLTSPVIHPKGGKHEKENFDIQKKQYDNKRRRKRRKRSSSLKTVESDDESKTGYFRGRKKKRHERRYSDDKGHFVSNTSSSSDNHKTVYPSLPKRRKSWNRSDNSYFYFKRKMSKPKKDKDLIKRVISKSGPSLSSQDSNLMKKLLASGTLGSVQSHVSPSEMHYTSVGVSSPDVDLFGDINFSGDTESVESCSEQKPTIDSLWNKDGLLIVDSDDSEIEVIIPEKKEPELIDLNSDDEVNMNTLLEDSTCNSSLVGNIIVDDNKSPNEDTNAADSILGETGECNNLNEITSGEPPEAVNSCAAITSEEQIDKTNTVLLENGDDSALCTVNESDVKSTDQENVVEYASVSKIAETLCTINESDVKSTDQENVVEYSSVSKIAETEEQVHEKLVEENMHLDFQTNQEEPGVIIAVCNDEVDKVSAVIELSQTEVSQENENTVCHSSTESDVMEKSAVITEQCILEVSLENKAQEMLQHCKIENINEDERKESVSDEQENIKENCDKLDEDDDLIELRMIALNSSKEKCKELSDTEDTKNQVEKKQEEEELELRMAALKSAILKKHKERLQKGVVIKKNKTEALDDSVINSLDVMNDEVTRDSTNVSDTNDLKSCLQSKPSSPAEISLQGEEDMEIVDSDTGGEILEDNVNNECGFVMPNSNITDVFHSKCYCPSSVEPPPPGLETFPSCEPPPPGVDLYVKCPSIIDPHWNNSNRLHNGFQQFCISQPPPPPPPPPVPLLSFTQNQLPPPPPPPPADVKINSTIFSASVNNMTPTYSNITNTSNAHSSISSGSRCYHSHEPLLQPKQELNNSIYVNYSNTASVINKSSLSNNQELILACDTAYENSDIVNSENYAENFIDQPNLNEKLCSEIYEGETVNKVVENIGESPIKETNGTKTKSSLRPNLVTVPLQASTSSTTQLKKPQVRRRRRRKTNSSNNNSVDHDKNESSDVPDQSIESAVDSNQEANTDVPNDLEGMIVLDEVGWSPDENQQDTSKTSLSDNKESFEEDVEEDENILRAKALTSLASSNVQQEKIKQVQQTVIKQIVKPKPLMKETIQPKAAIRPYQNYVKNNSSYNMPPKRLPHVTRTVNFNDNSRYRLSRVVNNEARRSMIKGNSLQVMIPTDSLSPMSPHMSQVSPPLVSRLVINVGADSDSDEEDDDDDNSDWTRTVTIRDEDKSKIDIVAPNINQKDFEKSVEMFLMSVRKQHETCHNDDTREDPETKPFSINENSENKENQHEMELQIQRGSKEDDSSKSVQHPVETKQLEQQPKNQHSKAVNSGGMLRDVLSSEMRKNIENAQHSSDYNHCVLKDNEQTKNERAHEEELYENSKSGAESSTSECGSHKTDESMVTEEKRKLLKLDLLAQERKHELQRSERELVEKRYSAIDRLTEMQELLGDYEAVKGKLETYEEQVVRLQNELTAAEEKLNKHKQIVSDMKHDFFAHYTKMLIVSNYCDRLEEKCDRLGSDILGTEYALPKTGKTMLTKKLQQVSEKQIRLDLTEDSKTVTTNRVHTGVTPRLNTTSSTNILHTDVISGDNTIKSDEARQTIGTLNHNQMNQLEMRVDTKIVNPVATKTLSPLAKVPLKQALTHQDVKQTLTQMPQRFSRNLKFSRQLTVRFPQRGRSTRLVNYKPYPEISKKLSVPQSVDTRFISSQSVPVSTIPSSSPLRFQSSPLRVSVTMHAHENEQETVDQPKAAITNLPINSKISASNSVDSNTVDSSDENTNRMVKYECVSQEITRPAKTLTNLRSTSRLKDYRSPLLHLHNSVDHGGLRDVHSKILCPFELMGSCRDEDCTFLHHKDCLPQGT